MRSTSAAEASSTRLRWSTKPVALSKPGVSLFVSMGFDLLLIPMMSQPSRGKAFPPFLLKNVVHKTVILGGVAGDAVQDKGAMLEGKGPLPHFPQFIVGIALGLHHGNLVNRRVFQAHLVINLPNHGF